MTPRGKLDSALPGPKAHLRPLFWAPLAMPVHTGCTASLTSQSTTQHKNPLTKNQGEILGLLIFLFKGRSLKELEIQLCIIATFPFIEYTEAFRMLLTNTKQNQQQQKNRKWPWKNWFWEKRGIRVYFNKIFIPIGCISKFHISFFFKYYSNLE